MDNFISEAFYCFSTNLKFAKNQPVTIEVVGLSPNSTYLYFFNFLSEREGEDGLFKFPENVSNLSDLSNLDELYKKNVFVIKTFTNPLTAGNFTIAFASCAKTGSTSEVFRYI